MNGAVLYKTFGRVVDYSDYYCGVRRVFARDCEAVGYVSVPANQPIGFEPGYCDPVTLDNFLQVAGIHVNCLWECKDDEVFVCTAIRELLFGEHYLKGLADKRSWIVYSNFEPTSSGSVSNDIFVLDSQSGDMVLTLMGAQFTRFPYKTLSRTLSKLNDIHQPEPPKIFEKEARKTDPMSKGIYDLPNGTDSSSEDDAE